MEEIRKKIEESIKNLDFEEIIKSKIEQSISNSYLFDVNEIIQRMVDSMVKEQLQPLIVEEITKHKESLRKSLAQHLIDKYTEAFGKLEVNVDSWEMRRINDIFKIELKKEDK